MAYQQYRPNSFNSLPMVVKNLLIINILLFVVTNIYVYFFHVDPTDYLALYYFGSPAFQPYQLVTYMFMHGSLFHILFNMYGLVMFGKILETVWGPKRFLFFYMVTGIGAALIQMLVTYIRLHYLSAQVAPAEFSEIISRGYDLLREGKDYVDPVASQINLLVNIPAVGASGALFGILAAFGMLFPNTELFIMFIPVPIKAKYAVIGYGVLELFLGLAQFAGDNIAHFAHIGGALFGFILVWYWKKRGRNFY